ncbi:MAG: phosphoglucosamine mutase [Planctomycetes bacterium]|nr:phosphoglucosamine mutase [Planctomycetota bacterium]
MQKKLFGTDGIRDVANTGLLSSESVFRLGTTLGSIVRKQPSAFRNPFAKKQSRKTTAQFRNCILLGKDTRISKDLLSDALKAGIYSSGVNVCDAGIIPTPELAFLAKTTGAPLAIMISASHNPYHDNGIKLLSPEGLKIPDSAEKLVENIFCDPEFNPLRASGKETGIAVSADNLPALYSEFLLKIFKKAVLLKGKTIVMDCANGATHKIAPEIFRRFGAKVIAEHCAPNGININAACGALHPECIGKLVVRNRAFAGFSFDGDGDRVIITDEKGTILDGDYILAISAIFMKRRGQLKGNTLVTTVMHNLGLKKCMDTHKIKLVQTPVGDKFVAEEMFKGNYALGGEQSGHIIYRKHSSTGDGIITALSMLAIACQTGQKLSELAKILRKFPQVLINVKVKQKTPFNDIKTISIAAEEIKNTLGDRGRLLLRYSGTEPLARIMIEGEDQKLITGYANTLAGIIENELGR